MEDEDYSSESESDQELSVLQQGIFHEEWQIEVVEECEVEFYEDASIVNQEDNMDHDEENPGLDDAELETRPNLEPIPSCSGYTRTSTVLAENPMQRQYRNVAMDIANNNNESSAFAPIGSGVEPTPSCSGEKRRASVLVENPPKRICPNVPIESTNNNKNEETHAVVSMKSEPTASYSGYKRPSSVLVENPPERQSRNISPEIINNNSNDVRRAVAPMIPGRRLQRTEMEVHSVSGSGKLDIIYPPSQEISISFTSLLKQTPHHSTTNEQDNTSITSACHMCQATNFCLQYCLKHDDLVHAPNCAHANIPGPSQQTSKSDIHNQPSTSQASLSTQPESQNIHSDNSHASTSVSLEYVVQETAEATSRHVAAIQEQIRTLQANVYNQRARASDVAAGSDNMAVQLRMPVVGQRNDVEQPD